MNYVWAFAVGGAICVVGQLLIDYTKLTPARILTGYVVAGVILSAVGLYKPLVDLAGAGASVPLLGFWAPAGAGRATRGGRVRSAGGLHRRADGSLGRHCCQPDFRRSGRACRKKQGPELKLP